jgi:hypothetical protein
MPTIQLGKMYSILDLRKALLSPYKITQCRNPDDHTLKYNFLTKFGLLTVSWWILALACSS